MENNNLHLFHYKWNNQNLHDIYPDQEVVSFTHAFEMSFHNCSWIHDYSPHDPLLFFLHIC
jgi:hypothetical protein